MSSLIALKKTMSIALGAVVSEHADIPVYPGEIVSNPTRRSKLWELDRKHHCPIVGTCLPIDELTKLAHRHFDHLVSRGDHAMHVEAVNRSNTRNHVSEAIHKHLETKFRVQVVLFDRAKNDHEVLTTWQEHLATGDVAGALWAAMTHRFVSPATRQRILADIHMLSHQLGAGQAAQIRRIAKLEEENDSIRTALQKQKELQVKNESTLRSQLKEFGAERDQLRTSMADVKRMQTRLAAFESGSVMMEMGQKLLALQTANNELRTNALRTIALEKAIKAIHEETQTLTLERDQLIAERDALKLLLLTGEFVDSDEQNCDQQCLECEKRAHNQCILYVGGRNSLLTQYRALAERLGIQLIHHDGGLEKSLSRLPDMINKADAVMCPTDCVSHSAYYQLKRQCKRSGKPCLLFKGAGVSGFAVALARLSSNRPISAETTC